MIITQQKKGKRHIDYINELAVAYWAKLDFTDGMYCTCLRDAMKEHREYLIRCVEEQRRIDLESKRTCRDCLTPLDQHDFFHYGLMCRDCFTCRMNNEVHDDEHAPIPPRIPLPPRIAPNPRFIL